MRADIHMEDENLQGVPISRAEAFGSASDSSEGSEGSASPSEGEIDSLENGEGDDLSASSDAETEQG